MAGWRRSKDAAATQSCSPASAVPRNGTTLFTINPQKKVAELDRDHKEVWSYSEGLEHPIAAQRLANGNTLISDARLGKVIEVTPDKRVVWKYESTDLANMP